jgi:hypothetical protein
MYPQGAMGRKQADAVFVPEGGWCRFTGVGSWAFNPISTDSPFLRIRPSGAGLLRALQALELNIYCPASIYI